ncbi:hypothetical protein CW745_15470 [Psychromonas sp. psych-6C06]|nr:prepilin-type N-terminal cleavage/methylation domain-containing protein [Psychromonas sp. psych-6C06]PKF60343.1 hypothetical protein CW745_15470 [Psychromonas sp. psych-6C06]
MFTARVRQAGFSLLEIMSALVISNIALLGLATGQIKGRYWLCNICSLY